VKAVGAMLRPKELQCKQQVPSLIQVIDFKQLRVLNQQKKNLNKQTSAQERVKTEETKKNSRKSPTKWLIQSHWIVQWSTQRICPGTTLSTFGLKVS